jgi:hypothetical protein
MGLEPLGNLGYTVGAVGIILVTVLYFLLVRWWNDHLGRVIAAVLGSISLVLITTILRMMHVGIPHFMVWRATMFWLFGLAVWAGLLTLIWAQFFAPRVKQGRLPTPPRRGNESEQEADLADYRLGRHGGTDDDPAGER